MATGHPLATYVAGQYTSGTRNSPRKEVVRLELLLAHILGDALARDCGVLMVAVVLSIAARFTLAVIALHKARPEHVADIIKAVFRHRW
jgi:hypothetical protein